MHLNVLILSSGISSKVFYVVYESSCVLIVLIQKISVRVPNTNDDIVATFCVPLTIYGELVFLNFLIYTFFNSLHRITWH